MGVKRLSIQTILLLAPPLAFVLWLCGGWGARWLVVLGKDFNESVFAANSILLMLIYLGHVMTLVNLGFYWADVRREAFGTRGKEDGSQRDLRVIFGLTLLLVAAIAVFLAVSGMAYCGVPIPRVTFPGVVTFNHIFLVLVFLLFAGMDGLAVRRYAGNRVQDPGAYGSAMMSLLLVSIPGALVTGLALVMHFVVVRPEWMLIYDKPVFLSESRYGYLHVPLVPPADTERAWFSLFVSGMNTGMAMASIVVSQLTFCLIQWFRRKAFWR